MLVEREREGAFVTLLSPGRRREAVDVFSVWSWEEVCPGSLWRVSLLRAEVVNLQK